MYKKGNIITVINEENKNYGKEFKVINDYFDIWDGNYKVEVRSVEHPRSRFIFKYSDIELVSEEE